ncbi:MAG: BCCT family transporter [Anaerovoracaceae bacterium]
MKSKNINIEVTLISIVIVLLIAVSLLVIPEQSLSAINVAFNFVSTVFGTPLLWFSLFATLMCFYLALSKYGKIRLGEGSADFSLFSYIGMMICAGLASASVYFSFVEWIFFYTGPAIGIEPMSVEASEWAPAYSFTYWGLISWPPFALAAIPIALSYYKRNNTALRFSIVCEDLFNLKEKSLIGKIIDILFIVTTLGGLSVTLGLGVPLISTMVSYIAGTPDNFASQVVIVIVISVIFTLSSYVGLEKGMRKISDTNIYLAIIFVIILLVTGPTLFIVKYLTNGFGLAVQNYLRILLWTDPVNNAGFSEAWVIFYICFAVAYAPLMSLFITKISKGRTIKEMILSTVVGGTFGCILLFGINGGFGMHAQLTGAKDIVGIFNSSGAGETIIAILSMVPLPVKLMTTVFFIMLLLFLSTSLDSASFSLASTATKTMSKEESPSPLLRLFWCILLALIPLGLMFAGAPLSALQTVSIVTAIPFAGVIVVYIIKSFKWLNEEVAKLEESKPITKEEALDKDNLQTEPA